MYCLCFVILLAGSVAAAQAAEDFLEPGTHLPHLASLHAAPAPDQPVSTGTSVVLIRPAITAAESGAEGPLRQPPASRPQQESLWTTNSHWQPITLSGDGRVSFSPILLTESKDEKLEIKPKRNSLWMLWRKKFQ